MLKTRATSAGTAGRGRDAHVRGTAHGVLRIESESVNRRLHPALEQQPLPQDAELQDRGGRAAVSVREQGRGNGKNICPEVRSMLLPSICQFARTCARIVNAAPV